MLANIKAKAKQLKKQITVVYLAYMHKDIKWYTKAFLLLILVYALSPIDLIPDFVPILGYLDDIILIPLGIVLAMKMIPKKIWEECRQQAENGVNIDKRYKRIGAILIILIWAIVISIILRNIL